MAKERDSKIHIINLDTRMPEGKGTKNLTKKEWEKEGNKLFGSNEFNWKFICPSCGNIQTPEDFRKYKGDGATPSDAYFKCIGRFIDGCEGSMDNEKSPCNYTQGGLLILSQIIVTDDKGKQHKVFDFYRGEP